MRGAGIYIHIPFCVQKCIYCDFNSIPGCSEELQSGYFDALKQEITDFQSALAFPKSPFSSDGGALASRKSPSSPDGGALLSKSADSIGSFSADVDDAADKNDEDVSAFADTLFIGGGTPSSVPPHLIEELMDCIRKSEIVYGVCSDQTVQKEQGEQIEQRESKRFLSQDAEVTMEINPGTVDRESLIRYRKAGINRLSMGVQSFCDEELRFLGRIHSAKDAEQCFYDARKAGFDNINIDLIFGFPGNTIESWRQTLKKALNLKPDHISFYSLQIEEGTPLYRMFREDAVEQVSDEINRQMYHEAVKLLQENGYLHYEISNASLPGRQCQHNLKYWSMCDYIGFGVSAHSYLRDHIFDDPEKCNGIRYFNEDDIFSYMARIKSDDRGYIPFNVFQNSLTDEISESIFTAMRKTEGLDIGWFDRRFAGSGITFLDEYGEKIEPFLRDGFLVLEKNHLRFTLKGFDISNYILSELI